MEDKKIKFKISGFTMIELIVIIGIVAFIMSAAMYLYAKTKEDARIAKAKGYASVVNSKLGSNMIGWWTFDEGTGTNAKDGWAKNNGCKGSGGGNTWEDGIFGKAFIFDRNSSFSFPVISGCGGTITAGKLSPSITSNNITFTAWFKTTSVGTIAAIGSGRGFGLIQSGIDMGKLQAPGSSSSLISSKDYRDNKWHFAAAKMGSEGTQIWVDGVIVGEDKTAIVDFITPSDCCEYLNVGVGKGAGWAGFGGTIDDVRLFNESLSAREIKELYAESAPKYLAVK